MNDDKADEDQSRYSWHPGPHYLEKIHSRGHLCGRIGGGSLNQAGSGMDSMYIAPDGRGFAACKSVHYAPMSRSVIGQIILLRLEDDRVFKISEEDFIKIGLATEADDESIFDYIYKTLLPRCDESSLLDWYREQGFVGVRRVYDCNGHIFTEGISEDE